jgi:hypothetical protein
MIKLLGVAVESRTFVHRAAKVYLGIAAKVYLGIQNALATITQVTQGQKVRRIIGTSMRFGDLMINL